jgi:hypothetical protein
MRPFFLRRGISSFSLEGVSTLCSPTELSQTTELVSVAVSTGDRNDAESKNMMVLRASKEGSGKSRKILQYRLAGQFVMLERLTQLRQMIGRR